MIRYSTAGESHGKGLLMIAEGFPSNIPVTQEFLNNELRRRQMGYGRGGRMKIETDTAEVISGIRFGKTMGSPVGIMIQNKDWENWTEKMAAFGRRGKTEKITIPRPGHADLTGSVKYDFDDIRNSIERSSARETAARVAAGAVAKSFLAELGITVGSFVESIGGVYPDFNFADLLAANDIDEEFSAEQINQQSDASDVRVLDELQEDKIIRKIKACKKMGDTLGGSFCVAVSGVPTGLGSFASVQERLDAALSGAIVGINAVKGVEIGEGFHGSRSFGSEVHDEIILKKKVIRRKTNRSGGIEGGISTGEVIWLRGYMKPIATLMSPIRTVDLKSGKEIEARRERSDFVAVPACAVIAESVTAWVIADFVLRKFGGDSLSETKRNFTGWKKYLNKRRVR
ncbi:MAG: chorismate synthase [Ignavibacteriales bacterium]|nr:MAG: chorismate synthase [Ignavibacteriales bacterium]